MSRTETPKTRLEEILPTPEKVSQGGEGRCVRSRVVSHMQKLMMGGVGLYTMGCTGFGVVDPLPDPSRCVDEQGKLGAVGKYVTDPKGAVLEITLTPTAGAGSIKFSSSSRPSSNLAEILSSQIDAVTGVLTMRVLTTGTSQVSIWTSAECLGTYGSFTIRFVPPASPKVGDTVAITVQGE